MTSKFIQSTAGFPMTIWNQAEYAHCQCYSAPLLPASAPSLFPVFPQVPRTLQVFLQASTGTQWFWLPPTIIAAMQLDEHVQQLCHHGQSLAPTQLWAYGSTHGPALWLAASSCPLWLTGAGGDCDSQSQALSMVSSKDVKEVGNREHHTHSGICVAFRLPFAAEEEWRVFIYFPYRLGLI